MFWRLRIRLRKFTGKLKMEPQIHGQTLYYFGKCIGKSAEN